MNIIKLEGLNNENMEIAKKTLLGIENTLFIEEKLIKAFMQEKTQLEFEKVLNIFLNNNSSGQEYVIMQGEEYVPNIKKIKKIKLKNMPKINLIINLKYLFTRKNTFDGKLKLPQEFNNIPTDYQQTIEKMYNGLIKMDNQDVKMMLVTGSCNRGCVYNGWSDVDLIIVLDKYNNQLERNYISNLTKKCCIKVGTTAYSRKEFESLTVDYKTTAAIYEINMKRYRPTIFEKDLRLPVVSFSTLIEKGMNTIPDILHSMRRSTYTYASIDYIKLFKDLSHCMRVLVWMENNYPNDYNDVAQKFYEIYGVCKYNPYEFLEAIVSQKNEQKAYRNLLETVKLFLEFCNYIILEKKEEEKGKYDYTKIRSLQNCKK